MNLWNLFQLYEGKILIEKHPYKEILEKVNVNTNDEFLLFIMYLRWKKRYFYKLFKILKKKKMEPTIRIPLNRKSKELKKIDFNLFYILHKQNYQQVLQYLKFYKKVDDPEQVTNTLIDYDRSEKDYLSKRILNLSSKDQEFILEMINKTKPLDLQRYSNMLLYELKVGGSREIYIRELGQLLKKNSLDHPLFQKIVLMELFYELDLSPLYHILGDLYLNFGFFTLEKVKCLL